MIFLASSRRDSESSSACNESVSFPSSSAPSSSSSSSSPLEQDNKTYATSLGSKTKDDLQNDLLVLHKKYNELVEYTVLLTTERDALRRKLEHTRRK
mmetsp:Transcript_10036/g.16814  ORF Transcript_10036/g.16814 Transcript_10036/m.16814 type:complete len:97 (+) Transcript_10036:354-644(+)